MPTKSAELGVVNHEHVGENGIRRSSRISSNTSRHPSLVFPPSDSRKSISRQDPSVANHAGRKRNRNSSVSDTESNKSKTIAKRGNKNQDDEKSNNSDTRSIIDLAEDSDEANSKIQPAKSKKPNYDPILEFFSKPFYPENASAEELKKPPITYHCKWCHKKLRGGYNSDANLRKHRDGSNQAGRDGSGIVIPEYWKMREDLKKKSKSLTREDPLHPMFSKMIDKVEIYLEESLSCETLVMATILNPTFRLAFFENCFPTQTPRAKEILYRLFEERKKVTVETRLQNERLEKEKEASQIKETEKKDENVFSFFSGPSKDPGKDELEIYLGGIDRCDNRNDKDLTFSALSWWKVHEKKYTILSMLAKDYLGCIAASAAVERTFSAAADVCTNERGRLLPRTIETCVSSRLWIKEGLQLGERFDTAEKQRNNYKLFCEEKDSKKKKIHNK
ncbi:hypothetical protein PGT21_026567 [Puccinia graminis f. sp. tritici]|uniref:HAT C-terminal dimerisation domain-containing protein n=1 Tax=Puccinia graminis f. sp. tritici TaxID=56615 RepID=A0A5B0NB55_PUCGR|nr:hypothetical protein PGT21_026567 [Puccinia graminis f. sp. tritici]